MKERPGNLRSFMATLFDALITLVPAAVTYSALGPRNVLQREDGVFLVMPIYWAIAALIYVQLLGRVGQRRTFGEYMVLSARLGRVAALVDRGIVFDTLWLVGMVALFLGHSLVAALLILAGLTPRVARWGPRDRTAAPPVPQALEPIERRFISLPVVVRPLLLLVGLALTLALAYGIVYLVYLLSR